MPLRTAGRGRTNGICLLTNCVLTDKFYMELQRRIQGGGRGGRAPSPQKFQPCFFAAWHACSARLTFDQRTVYVLSAARVSRSAERAPCQVKCTRYAVCVTAGRSI